MVANRLQHRKHRQISLAASGLVDLGISLEHGDHVMRHLIDGVLVHFAHIEHRIGQCLIVREPVDIRHQPFDRGQLQVFDQILGGLVRSRSQRDEMRSAGNRSASNAPRQSIVARDSVVAPALCNRFA